MNKKILYIIIFLLFSLNLLQVYSNLDSQKKINLLEKKVSHDLFSTSRITPLKINKEIRSAEHNVFLVSLFVDGGCTECMHNEVYYINNLLKNYRDRIFVFYAGKRKEKMNTLGAKFQFRVIEPNEIKYFLNENLSINNPISLIVDSNKRIQSLHVSDPLNLGTSREFYDRVKSLFEATD